MVKTAQANGLNVVKYLEWMFDELKNKRDPFGRIKEEDFRKVLPYRNYLEIPDKQRNSHSNYVSGIAFQKLAMHPHLTAIRHDDNLHVFSFVSQDERKGAQSQAQ